MIKDKWIWMPHAGHFICGSRCQFKLNTYVGQYIVSTVGELKTSENASKFEQIGCDRLYETMVFKAKKSKHKCCPYEAIIDGGELDFEGYNSPEDAMAGHNKMCTEWSEK